MGVDVVDLEADEEVPHPLFIVRGVHQVSDQGLELPVVRYHPVPVGAGVGVERRGPREQIIHVEGRHPHLNHVTSPLTQPT
jgi:hypothetical protein